MSRTTRGVPYKHYWGGTKEETKRNWEEAKEVGVRRWHDQNWIDRLERNYLLYGTDARNWSYPTHEYFNRVNRIGRRIERDSLRPHLVMDEDYEFDDSHYIARYKGVWWEIY